MPVFLINRKSLSRRTFLHGSGIALALPMLEAMMPQKASAQETPTRFFGFFYPNGTLPSHFFPTTFGKLTQDKLSPCLQDLIGFSSEGIWPSCASLINDISVIDNLHHDVYETGIHDVYWSFRAHKKSSRQVIKSLDQKILEIPKNNVGFGHLAMASTGATDTGQGYISWRDTNTPSDTERDPTRLFNRIFGAQTGSDSELQITQRKAKLLDFLNEDLKRLKKGLGQEDKNRVDFFVESVDQLQSELQTNSGSCNTSAISGNVNNWHDKSKYFIDIAVLAMACDLTRVATLQYSNSWGVNYRDYILGDGAPDAAGTIGVGNYSDHFISHRLGDRDSAADLAAIPNNIAEKIATDRVVMTSRFKVRRFAYLVDKLRSVNTPTGTLLDESLALYASENGNGDNHARLRMPTLLAGRAGGFSPGRVIDARSAHTAALHCAILNRFGFNLENYGDPTEGPLTGI